MKIRFASVFVNDQAAALAFYTEVLGFVKKTDVPVGAYRFLTVTAPDEPEGMELLLEPADHPAAVAYQQAIFADGIPATSFLSEDLEGEYARLLERGVVFRTPPTDAGGTTVAVFEDTCTSLIVVVPALWMPPPGPASAAFPRMVLWLNDIVAPGRLEMPPALSIAVLFDTSSTIT